MTEDEKKAYYQEHKKNLIVIHDQLKEFPRMDLYDQTLLGTWKARFSEYLSLFCKSVEELSAMGWVSETIPNGVCHDILSTIGVLRNIYITDGFLDRHNYDIIPDLKITRKEFYEITGLTDLNKTLLWFESLLMDIHHYTEFDELTSIHGIYMGRVSIPHNGYYYRWFCRYDKNGYDWEAREFDYIKPIRKDK